MTSQQFWKMLEAMIKSPETHQLVPGIIKRAYDLDLSIPVVMNSKGQVFCEAQGRKFGYCAAGLTFNPKMGKAIDALAHIRIAADDVDIPVGNGLSQHASSPPAVW